MGVDRSRHGEIPRWGIPSGWLSAISKILPRRSGRFASLQAAQRWYEWRRFGRLAVLLTFGCVVVLLSTMLWKSAFKGSPLLFLAIPLYFSIFMAMLLGGVGLRREQLEMSPFLASRPLSSAGFVLVKFQAAAVASLMSCAIALVGMFIAVVAGGKTEHWLQVWRSLTAYSSTPQLLLLVVLVPVGYLALTWLISAQSLFIKLCGRPWVEVVFGVLVGGGLLGGNLRGVKKSMGLLLHKRSYSLIAGMQIGFSADS